MKRLKFCLGLGALAATALILFWTRSSSERHSSSAKPETALPQEIRATRAGLAASSRTPSATAKAPSPNESISRSPDAFTNFEQWMEQFSRADANERALLEGTGRALAYKRREAMLDLIQNDPEKALALAAPVVWQQQLPDSLVNFFEERVDGRGDLQVLVATDFERNKAEVLRYAQIGGSRFQTFVYGRRIEQRTSSNLPLNGIVLDGMLALSSDPIRVLAPEEVRALNLDNVEAICGVSGFPSKIINEQIVARVGNEIQEFCRPEHVRLMRDQLLASEKVLLQDNWTQGPKTLLYIRINFPDDLTEPISEAGAYSVMSDVNSYYVENSYNSTAITTTVTPLVTLPRNKDWYSTYGVFALRDDARNAARAAGFETDNYDLDIITLTSVPGYSWGGLGMVGGKGTWLQSTGDGVTSHELGHNYGLWHANSWWTDEDSILGLGVHIEYGNIFDTMGRASAGKNQFNAMHKTMLDWIPSSYYQTVVSNGAYRIHAFDVPNRVRGRNYALKIRKDFDRDYWAEFHQQFTDNPFLMNGAIIQWDPWDWSNGGTHLLDMTPGSPTEGGDTRDDAALVVGRTLSDHASGVHITTLARGGMGQDSWLDINVNFGDSSTNSPPQLKVVVDQTNAAPGTRINFRAVATDPDNDALSFHWSFADQTFSTNNGPNAFRTWQSNGEYVVRCVASDMKGGVASANVLVKIGEVPGLSRVSGRITDENGNPIEGVRVDNGEVETLLYAGAYTDSNGEYVIGNVTAELFVFAAKCGYSFTPDGDWPNPVGPGSIVENANFIGTALPRVTMTTTNDLVGESGSLGHFVISRTGPVDSDLVVYLAESGTASFSDYFLNASSPITIPAGASQVEIELQPIDDTSAEGPEGMTLSILEDAYYLPGALGERTITIIDNDTATKPAVSVMTGGGGDNFAPESGEDSGRFIFSRTGSTANDLAILYTVSGTALQGVDYSTLPGVVIIPAGSSSRVLEFQAIDDTLVETNETVVITLSANAAYSVSGSSPKVTIVDDDLITVTITPTKASAAEPAATGQFTVTRAGDLSANLVIYYTLGGTASAGIDYQPLPGSVTLAASNTTAFITITPINDTTLEGDESVTVSLQGNPTYNVGIPGTATIFIKDDERATITITASDNTASEPGSDTGSFTVSRGSVINGNLAVDLLVNGSAISGVDYIPIDLPVIIPDGSNSVEVPIIVFDDLHVENTENVILTPAASTNYNAGSKSATVKILDEDSSSVPAIGFTFAASTNLESLSSAAISLSLSATSTAPVTVDFQIFGGTATGGGVDYFLENGTITVLPGESAGAIPFTVINDSVSESSETIRVVLSNPTGATLDGLKFHTYTIADDDLATVRLSVISINAFESASVPAIFRFSRSGSTNNTLTVNFQVTGTASWPSDYTSIGTSVAIPAGATNIDVAILPADDNTVEINETVTVTLSSAPGANIGAPAQGTVNIVDNDTDTLPVVSVVGTDSIAGEPGTNTGLYIFSRSTGSGSLTVNFTVAGTATIGTDYILMSTNGTPAGTELTFLNGQTSAELSVVPIDDSTVEGDESAIINLTAADNYRVTTSTSSNATVTIQDNDQRVWMEVSDATAAEPGEDTGEFTFYRFGTTNADVTVNFSFSGTASNGVDFAAITNSILIPSNQLSAVLLITPLDDLSREGPETISVTALSGSGYALEAPFNAPTNKTVTINDDEPMISIVATKTNASENGIDLGEFTITRSGDTNIELTVRLAISGTATFGVDYPEFPTNVFLPRGISTAVISITPTNDLLIEDEETVEALLLPDELYTVVSPSNAIVTIADVGSNAFPVVSITSPAANIVFLESTNDINMILESTVSDDAETPPTVLWSQISGPGTVTFGDAAATNTTANFPITGVYVLRLLADDTVLQSFKDLTVAVNANEALAPDLLHWKLDDTNGVADDATLLGRTGVVVAATSVTNGYTDSAFSFDGVGSHIYENSGSNFLNGLDAITVALWTRSAMETSSNGVFTTDTISSTNTSLGLAHSSSGYAGQTTNILKASIATTEGTTGYETDSGVISTNWQHVALTWNAGDALSLFINGEINLPKFAGDAVEGKLTNGNQLIIGKGPFDPGTNFWNGFLDDVRIYSRALDAGETRALAAMMPTNIGPAVYAGEDVTIQLITELTLSGSVTDDGRPLPPGALSNVWSMVSGPGTVTFDDTNSLTASPQFSDPGTYVLRLVCDDGEVKIFDEITVTVTEPTTLYLSASDYEAAELGPDNGQFTLYRVGDIDVNLDVYLNISGTAAAGPDYESFTNVITIPAGSDTVMISVNPFLDNRTEADEYVVLTIQSNLAYSIGSPTANVVIHDSPYGMWTVFNFTLEELTDPNLSSETADFDDDGIINFIEYAFYRDPKVADSNSVITTAIELNSADSQDHITLTYQRRRMPVDVIYATYISNDLLTWNSGTDYLEEVQVTDDGNGFTETVKERIKAPYSLTTNHFITIKVTRPVQ